MNFRVLLAAFTLLLAGASCAQAGVIVDVTFDNAVDADSAAVGAQSDWTPPVDSDEPARFVQGGDFGDLAGFSLASVQSSSAQALVASELLMLPLTTSHWQVALANAKLPPSPLLCGLLKPS
ncbi:hypothetical protein [Roseimaritima ulvae]|uniref:hypothetical protein n=1 Tax=Roseimaritima ulvae TaxID=980254 RepID=UPI0008372F2D|nr:hypothetical protein [Roseimaritima ulvae]